MLALSILSVVSTSLFAPAIAHAAQGDHSHVARNKLLPDTWYHPEDHPVYDLFRRAGPTDGATYPVVGSPRKFNIL